MTDTAQGADGAGTKTAGEIARDAFYSGRSELRWEQLAEASVEDWERAAAAVLASAPAATPGVPDSVRKAIAFAAEAEGAPNGRAARRYAGLCCLQWVETLLSPQADKQTEPPALRAVVEVYPDRTDTRLTFGDRIKPEPGVKAVQQAIAALTAEYEARGGCPVVGRQPAGQAGDAGAEETCAWAGGNDTCYCRTCGEEYRYGREDKPPCPRKPAPNSTRTGAAETELTERDIEAPIYEAFARYVGNADERASDFRMFATGYHAALAARPEAPSDAGWLPIETQPNPDETYADLPGDARDGVGFATHEDSGEVTHLVWWKYLGSGISETTHWMPLPTPPSDPAPSGQAEG